MKISVFFLVFIVCNTFAQIFYKLGINAREPINMLIIIFSGGLLNVVGLIIWLRVIKVINISSAFPASFICTSILILLSSSLIFKEEVSIRQIFGILIGLLSVRLLLA